jgi:hypothetical protein
MKYLSYLLVLLSLTVLNGCATINLETIEKSVLNKENPEECNLICTLLETLTYSISVK